ncbi:MAG: histidine phosphatase family protein [Actinomycetota bacterium]
MHRLLLLRHAKSSWDDPALSDHERPLAARGHRAADRMAEHLRSEIPDADLILCSSALRTRETLQRMASAFGDPEVAVEDGLYGASDEELLDRLHGVPDRFETVALIGHNPGIWDLATTVAGSGTELDRMHSKFPTGALAVLEFDGRWGDLAPGGARLASFVTPKDVA